MYIALEGVVWVGKSTQAALLAPWLEEKTGQEIVVVREPWWTQIAQAIRTLVQATQFEETMQPITDAYLYASARAQLIHGVIAPALQAWKIVLSDRCVVSSLAYQWIAQKYGMNKVWQINTSALEWCLPDLIIFFDLDVALWLARTFDTEWDKRERLERTFFERAYEWYKQCFNFEPVGKRMVSLDATWSINEVFLRLQTIITTIV